MLLFDETQYGYLHEYPHTGTPVESGLAMIKSADADGNETLVVSTGAGGERFAGVSFADKHLTNRGVTADLEGTIPSTAPYTIQLPRTTNVTQFRAVRADGAAFAGAPTVTSTGLVTFNIGDAGADVLMTFSWDLTAAEKMWRHVAPIPPTATSVTDSLAVAVGHCRILTNSYDTSLAYTVNEDVQLGANGLFTNTGSGDVIGSVFRVPTHSEPYLGVEYNV